MSTYPAQPRRASFNILEDLAALLRRPLAALQHFTDFRTGKHDAIAVDHGERLFAHHSARLFRPGRVLELQWGDFQRTGRQ